MPERSTILLVSDGVIAPVILDSLAKKGGIVSVTGPSDVLRVLSERRWTLWIVDHPVGGYDGLDLAVRGRELCGDVPTIVVSSRTKAINRSAELGFTFVTKDDPRWRASLITIVERLIAQRTVSVFTERRIEAYEEALAQLQERVGWSRAERDVLLLRLQCPSAKEIAERRQTSPQTVRNQLYRAAQRYGAPLDVLLRVLRSETRKVLK